MNLELSESEHTLLADLLEIVYKEKLRELHHTATMAYKQELRRNLETIEGLRARLSGTDIGANR